MDALLSSLLKSAGDGPHSDSGRAGARVIGLGTSAAMTIQLRRLHQVLPQD